MPDGTPDSYSNVNLTNIENSLKDISDNLGSGDKKIFTECAMRLFANCDFVGNLSGKSPAQLLQDCINNALLFVKELNKAHKKYFKE